MNRNEALSDVAKLSRLKSYLEQLNFSVSTLQTIDDKINFIIKNLCCDYDIAASEIHTENLFEMPKII